MYGEKLALKSRLDELNKAEERIIRQYQEERERIYERLRKLDEDERLLPNNEAVQTELETTKEESSANLVEEQLKGITDQIREEMKKESQDLFNELRQQLEEAVTVISSMKQNQLPQPADSSINEEKVHIEQTEETNTNKNNKRNGRRNGRKSPALNVRSNVKDKIDYEPIYQVALDVLKRHTVSVQSVDLRKEVEEKVGLSIPNFTNFMARLMKKHPEIEKPYRGRYYFKREDGDSFSLEDTSEEANESSSYEETPNTTNIQNENDEVNDSDVSKDLAKTE